MDKETLKKELFQGITKERNNILKGVLEDQDKIIP